MSIPIYCEGCQRNYNAPDRCAGKRIQCKTCGGFIDVPAGQDEPIEADVVDEPAPAPPPPAKPAAKPAAAKPPAKPAAKPAATAQAPSPAPPAATPGAKPVLTRPHRKHKKARLPTFALVFGILALAGVAGLVTYFCLPGEKPSWVPQGSGSDTKTPPGVSRDSAAPAAKGSAALPAGKTAAASRPAPGEPALPGWTPLSDPASLLAISSAELPGMPPVSCGLVPASAPNSPFVLCSTRINLGETELEGERRLAVYDIREDKPPIRSLTLRNLPKLDGCLSPDGLHYAYIGRKDNQPALLLQSLESDADVKSQPLADAKWFDFAGAGRLVAYRPAKNAVSVWDYVGGQPAEFAVPPAPAAVAAVSPTGKYLALPAEPVKTPQGPTELKIHVYDLSTRKQAGTLSLPLKDESAAVEGLAFSPEGKLLAVLLRGPAGTEPSARIACWDLANGRLCWEAAYASKVRSPQPSRTALLFLPGEHGWVINGREVLQMGQTEPSRILPAKGDIAAPACSRVFASGLVLSVWLDPTKTMENVTHQYEDSADLAP